MAIKHSTPQIQDPRFSGPVLPLFVVSTLTTAAALTLTAAQIMGQLILRDPNGTNRTDTLPKATDLANALGQGLQVGHGFHFTIRNTADAAETITVAAGTGGTTSGTMTIAQNNSKMFKIIFTDVTDGAEKYTVYSLGTFVH